MWQHGLGARARYDVCMARKKEQVGIRLKRPLQRPFITEWRNHRDNLSQEALAARVEELLGTSFSASTLSRIENAKNPYSQRQLEAIAAALRCDPADLIMRNPLNEDALWSLVDSLRKATPEQREQVRAVADALLKTGTQG